MHLHNQSLNQLNSFALPAKAAQMYHLHSIEQLQLFSQSMPENFYILGGGSNTLFIEDFEGCVICPDFKGIEVTETDSEFCIHIASGENWHHLVQYCLKNNMPGLENLALIPGNCGAAPIQNIGAYGLEFAEVCDYVDWFEFSTGTLQRLSKQQCRFAYRDSIFKHEKKNLGVICAIGLTLTKTWQPKLRYQGLNRLGTTPTPQQVFDTVIAIRESKLPDPKILPNAGSFFKNPVVSYDCYTRLIAQYPALPAYPQPDSTFKLAAGWLIEQCDLKGVAVGGACVHQLQALVLVNTGHASGSDVVTLAKHVQINVLQKFAVKLEPEVRFITAKGERKIEDIV